MLHITPKFNGSKQQQTFLTSHSPCALGIWEQFSWMVLAPCFMLSRCQPGLQSLEGLVGAGGATSQVTHSQVGAGPGWAASAAPHMGLSTRLLECLQTWQLVSPGRRDSRDQGDIYHVFYVLSWKSHTLSSAVSCWSHESASCNGAGGYIWGVLGGADQGAILEAGYMRGTWGSEIKNSGHSWAP